MAEGLRGRAPLQILENHLSLSQPEGGGADYALDITTRHPRFSDSPPSLSAILKTYLFLCLKGIQEYIWKSFS